MQNHGVEGDAKGSQCKENELQDLQIYIVQTVLCEAKPEAELLQVAGVTKRPSLMMLIWTHTLSM